MKDLINHAKLQNAIDRDKVEQLQTAADYTLYWLKVFRDALSKEHMVVPLWVNDCIEKLDAVASPAPTGGREGIEDTMNGTVKAVTFGKGAAFTETDINADNLLSIDFTGSDGGTVSVEIRNGVVTVRTTNGRLILMPESANSARVRVEPL